MNTTRLISARLLWSLLAIGVLGLFANITQCRADNRPTFDVLRGETDDELTQLGRGWVCWYLYGPVWQDFDEDDSHVLVVQQVHQFHYSEDFDYEQCLLIAVENPGWRGHRGDKVTVQWERDLWHQHGVFAAKLVQLKTHWR